MRKSGLIDALSVEPWTVPAADRRERGRKRVARAAVMLTKGQAGIPCVVLELCASGARLEVDINVDAPDRFELVVQSEGLIVPCRKAWRRGGAMGVEFLALDPPALK